MNENYWYASNRVENKYRKTYSSTKPSICMSILVPCGRSNLFGFSLKIGRLGSGGGGVFFTGKKKI